jgi:hypothetical protein
VQQHLLDLLHAGAVVERAAHMALELVGLAQRGQHGDGDEAAGLQVQALALPGVAPGVAGDVFLQRRGELGQAAEGLFDEGLAHHALAHGQALFEILAGRGGHGGAPGGLVVQSTGF